MPYQPTEGSNSAFGAGVDRAVNPGRGQRGLSRSG